MAETVKPLTGIRVLDLTTALSGPYASQLMADLGADVAKVESITHSDNTRGVHPFIGEVSHYFVAINHDKRSLQLDLKQGADKKMLLRLVEKADVILSNLRAGALDALGLGCGVLAARNPRLIQCLISGFGQTESAYRRKSAFDATMQAMTGFMSVTSEPEGGPLRCGVSIGDIIPAVFAVQGITTALYNRERTGKGEVVDVAMFDCLFSALSYYITLTQATGASPAPSGTTHASVAPMGRFQASDGWLMIAAFTEGFWRNLCRAIGRPHWAEDSRFITMKERLANRDLLMDELSVVFRTRTRTEWQAILDEYDVPHSPVLNVLDVLHHPVVQERNLLRPQALPGGGTVQVSRQPVVYGAQVPDVQPARPAPALGQHSEEIIREWLRE
ncbi:MAG: CoA transferase [Betaproteobacteria bacterium]|nr:CoA transferase [Betaproteobacteria bacterium]